MPRQREQRRIDVAMSNVMSNARKYVPSSARSRLMVRVRSRMRSVRLGAQSRPNERQSMIMPS